eukprot:TRINITY_DN8950_c0_g1_i2.p1 TRINITY_DN8950_c0_g1~~TRINITY_DN8950_c0_g1_i2.p1  ORF type:complete len:213 (+),score=78.14 TRINITY_DN8950_c0_g1_i2:80-640(+)
MGDMNPLPILRSCPLIDNNGQRVSAAEVFAGVKVIGLYFSASWCPPCRTFSPVLDSMKEDSFKVVMITADRQERDFLDYIRPYSSFCAIPYGTGALSAIQRAMGVSMLPTLVVINAETGAVITSMGRMAVSTNRAKCVKDWEQGRAGVLSSQQWLFVYLAAFLAVTLLAYQFKLAYLLAYQFKLFK